MPCLLAAHTCLRAQASCTPGLCFKQVCALDEAFTSCLASCKHLASPSAGCTNPPIPYTLAGENVSICSLKSLACSSLDV